MNVLPSEQFPFASRSKSIFLFRFLFCCEISSCLLISVFRSLQMGQLGVVGKAPQTSTSKQEGNNKRHKTPFKIPPAILSSFDIALKLNKFRGRCRVYLIFMQLGFRLMVYFEMHSTETDSLSLASDTLTACLQ